MPFLATIALLDGIQGVLSGNSHYPSIYCGSKRYIIDFAYLPLVMKLVTLCTQRNLLLLM